MSVLSDLEEFFAGEIHLNVTKEYFMLHVQRICKILQIDTIVGLDHKTFDHIFDKWAFKSSLTIEKFEEFISCVLWISIIGACGYSKEFAKEVFEDNLYGCMCVLIDYQDFIKKHKEDFQDVNSIAIRDLDLIEKYNDIKDEYAAMIL